MIKLVFIAILLSSCTFKLRTNCKIVYKQISVIGYCDTWNDVCKVLTTDGSAYTRHMPIVGETIDIRVCEGEK